MKEIYHGACALSTRSEQRGIKRARDISEILLNTEADNNVPYSWTLSLWTLMQLSDCQSHLLYLTVDRYTVCPGDVAERKQVPPFHLGREMEQR